jgi:hypothetical protein
MNLRCRSNLRSRSKRRPHLQWSNRRLGVVSTAHVTNTTASSVTVLTFNLVPAKIGKISMNGVTVNASAPASLDDADIIVHLNSALAPNASADVTIRFQATSTRPTASGCLRRATSHAYRWIRG